MRFLTSYVTEILILTSLTLNNIITRTLSEGVISALFRQYALLVAHLLELTREEEKRLEKKLYAFTLSNGDIFYLIGIVFYIYIV